MFHLREEKRNNRQQAEGELLIITGLTPDQNTVTLQNLHKFVHKLLHLLNRELQHNFKPLMCTDVL